MKPQGMDWDERIEAAEKEIENLKKYKRIFTDLHADFKYNICISAKYGWIEIYNLDDLHKARELMRKAFGSWSDVMEGRFYSTGKATTTWNDKRNNFAIWLRVPVEEDPFIEDGCKWVPVERQEYTLVCSTESK